MFTRRRSPARQPTEEAARPSRSLAGLVLKVWVPAGGSAAAVRETPRRRTRPGG